MYLPKRRRNQHLVYDSDSLAYFEAAGIASITERTAWDAFVVGAKTAGVWDKCYRVYPVSPTSISAAAFCAKSLTNGTFVNAPTHATTGVTFDGATQYFQIDDSLDDIMDVDANTSNSYGIYNRSETFGSVGSTLYAFGADAASAGDAVIFYNTSPAMIARNHQVNNNLISMVVPLGPDRWILATRVSATSATLFSDATIVDTFVTSTTLAPPPALLPVYGARRTAISVAGFLAYEWAFGWIGRGLTTAECEDLYDLVQAYQTALGRAV